MEIASHKLIVPVILSGGSGTRLCPLSRDDRPKQFFNLLGTGYSIMQETIRRVSDSSMFSAPLMVGVEQHKFLIAEQLKALDLASAEIIVEPCGRNTAPAIVTAALHVTDRYGDALMLVLPTDQNIMDCGVFLDGVQKAAEMAAKGYLITFGIKPEYPETGYGYIRCGQALKPDSVFSVASFVEKPNPDMARQYIEQEGYLWNSGMFLFSSKALLKESEKYSPLIFEASKKAYIKKRTDSHFVYPDAGAYEKIPGNSVDYAIMEHTRRAAVVPLDCGWSDLGAWGTFWRLSDKDDDNNVRSGQCYALDTSHSYLRSEEGSTIAAYGVHNLVVVATKDVVLVTTQDHASELKNLVAQVRQNKPDLVSHNSRVFRPWGMFESLSNGKRYQVKLISVNPGEKLSLQMHYHRAEHWTIVSGTAKVTCGNEERILTENESIYIPLGSVHCIENPGKIPLDIIEVQVGAYLGEDDIVRLKDQYGRSQESVNRMRKSA